MKYLIIILLFVNCTAPYHVKKAIKKDPDYFKTLAEARMRMYSKYDTTYIYSEGKTDTIIKRVEVPKIEYITKQTWKEKRVDNKIAVLELKEAREQLRNEKRLNRIKEDSLKLANDQLKAFIKDLEAETRLKEAEAEAKEKENREAILKWIKSNWWWIVLVLIGVVLLVRFKFFKL